MSKKKMLTKKIAEDFLANPGSTQLDGFTAIEEEAAVLLAKSDEFLNLNGLTELSDEIAKALSRNKEGLSLDGLTSISDNAVEALVRMPGKTLCLQNVELFSEKAALALARREWDDLLISVSSAEFSEEAIMELVQHEQLKDCLSSITVKAAEYLAMQDGEALYLSITPLTDDVAQALAKTQGYLNFQSLTTLSDAAAEALSKHKGDLALGCLTTLSDAAAEALSKHKGDLALGCLTTLSDAAAEALARCEGALILDGLTTLSDSAAEALARCEGALYLDGLTTLSDSVAEALSKHKGNLFLRGLISLSDNGKKRLKRHSFVDTDLDLAVEPFVEQQIDVESLMIFFIQGDGAKGSADPEVSLARFLQDSASCTSDGKVLDTCTNRMEFVARLKKALPKNAGKTTGKARLSAGCIYERIATLESIEFRTLEWQNNGARKSEAALCAKLRAEALKDAELAVKLNPREEASCWLLLAELRKEAGDSSLADALGFYNQSKTAKNWKKKLELLEASLAADSTFPWAHNNIALHLATSKRKGERDGARAVEHALKACEWDGCHYRSLLDTLAAAYAENGEFEQAVTWQQKAISNSPEDTAEMEALLERYKSHQAYPFSEASESEEEQDAEDEEVDELDDEMPEDEDDWDDDEDDDDEDDDDEDDDDEDDDDEDDDEDEEEYVDDGLRPERANPSGTVTNSIGMKLVPIRAGTFTMGSPKKKRSREDCEVQHQVTLTRDFYLGMTPVTQAQCATVMGKNPSHFQGDKVKGRDSSEFPVESVSWEDALEFCKRLSEMPEEKAAGRVYRLPTEAEWEYACRADSTTAYCFGNDEGLLSDYAWFSENSEDRPHPVALKEPNAWGLHDMHGNVLEWCSDWYGDYPENALTDPVGPAEGSYRVIRGGGWCNAAAECRSAFRDGSNPSDRDDNDYGFRVALSSSGIPK